MKERNFLNLKRIFMRVMVVILILTIGIVFAGQYIGKHVKCTISDIEVDNIDSDIKQYNNWISAYKLNSKEFREICVHPQNYRQVYIECDTSCSCNIPIDIFNFKASDHSNSSLSKLYVGKQIDVINDVDTESGRIEIDTGVLNFSFIVKANGRTNDQITQDVQKSKIQMTGHTSIPFLNVKFDVKNQ